MKEKEYIKVSNLATLRAVRQIIDNLTPDDVIDEKKLQEIIVKLAIWEMELQGVI